MILQFQSSTLKKWNRIRKLENVLYTEKLISGSAFLVGK